MTSALLRMTENPIDRTALRPGRPALRPGRVKFGILAVALLASLVAVPADAQIREAETLVQETTDRMLALIEESRDYVDVDPERFYREVESLLTPVIDFPRFARSVMAVHYKEASEAQRTRFADGFKRGLIRTYALALTEFNDGGVSIVPSERPPRRPDRASVKQEIRSGGDVYPVVFSLALSDDGDWRVRNMIINGINMGLTYRNQFASAASDPRYGGDMDRVIDGWIEALGSDDASTAVLGADQAAGGQGATEADVDVADG